MSGSQRSAVSGDIVFITDDESSQEQLLLRGHLREAGAFEALHAPASDNNNQDAPRGEQVSSSQGAAIESGALAGRSQDAVLSQGSSFILPRSCRRPQEPGRPIANLSQDLDGAFAADANFAERQEVDSTAGGRPAEVDDRLDASVLILDPKTTAFEAGAFSAKPQHIGAAPPVDLAAPAALLSQQLGVENSQFVARSISQQSNPFASQQSNPNPAYSPAPIHAGGRLGTDGAIINVDVVMDENRGAGKSEILLGGENRPRDVLDAGSGGATTSSTASNLLRRMQQQRAVLGKKPLVAEIIPSFASRDGRAVKNPDAVDEDEDSHRLHRATSSKSTPGSTRAQKRVVLIPSHGVKRRKFEEEPEIISLHSSSGSDGEAQKGRPQSAVRKNLDDPASSARSRGRALSRGQDEENKINAVGAFQKRTPVSARGEQRNQQAFTSEAKSKGVGLAFNAFGGSTAFSSGAIEEPDAGSRSRVPPEPRTPARKTTPGNKRNRSESAAPRSAKAKASGSRSSARRPGAAKLQIVRDSFGRFVYDSLGEDELKRWAVAWGLKVNSGKAFLSQKVEAMLRFLCDDDAGQFDQMLAKSLDLHKGSAMKKEEDQKNADESTGGREDAVDIHNRERNDIKAPDLSGGLGRTGSAQKSRHATPSRIDAVTGLSLDTMMTRAIKGSPLWDDILLYKPVIPQKVQQYLQEALSRKVGLQTVKEYLERQGVLYSK